QAQYFGFVHSWAAAAHHVPELDREVEARRSQPRPVGAERHTPDVSAMRLDMTFLVGRLIPDEQSPIPADRNEEGLDGVLGTGPGGCGEVTALGAVGHTMDEAGVVLIREGHPARRVPDDHLPILAPRGEGHSIRAIREGRDRTPVARVRVLP